MKSCVGTTLLPQKGNYVLTHSNLAGATFDLGGPWDSLTGAHMDLGGHYLFIKGLSTWVGMGKLAQYKGNVRLIWANYQFQPSLDIYGPAKEHK